MDNTYFDGTTNVCPDCSYEWSENEETASSDVAKDSNGAELTDGDSVTVIKDLKVKGSSTVIKMGTRVTNIKIVDGDHDLDCRVDGMKIMLKSEFMKKA